MDVREIALSNGNGALALIDADDWARSILWEYRPGLIETFSPGDHSWFLQHRDDGKLYVTTSVAIDGRTYSLRLHRMILAAPPGVLVDHRTPNTLDNRRENLRLATPAQNNYSRAIYANALGFRGVAAKSQKFAARIRHDGRLIYLGTFETPEAAGRAYDAAARELFGEFAKLNFPNLLAGVK